MQRSCSLSFIMAIKITDILELDASERIQLAFDIWDSITAMPESIELSEEQKNILEQRIQEFYDHPESGSPWNEVKTRIRIGS